MATESPIRIIEASGKWPSHNDITAFAKSTTNMSIEDLGLLLKGQSFRDQKSSSTPNRSGSAPPSMEGSLASIENLMCANRPLFLRSANYRRFTSFDDSSEGSFHLAHSNLSTHMEESDGDRSPKLEDFPRAQSPVSNQSRPYDHEPVEEADHHDGDYTGQSSYSDPTTTPVSEDDVSIGDGSRIKNGIFSVSVSGIPNTESQRNQRDRLMFQVQGSNGHPHMISQSQTYVGVNPFLQTPSIYSSEVQPVLQSSGFTPPAYAAGPTYMMSGNPVYPNMIPAGYFPQQYSLGGYFTGYLPNVPVPMPFDANGSQSFIGQSQTSGVNLQHLNKFYGQRQPLGFVGHGNLSSRRVSTTSPYYLGSPTNAGVMQFPTPPFASPAMPGSPIGGVGFPGGRNEARSPSAPVTNAWQAHIGRQDFDDPKMYSFLEELKSGKGRGFELSDISGHVIEFCADQHGSRFIQQKLEICSVEEKESVFKEVLPNASRLITDVFGNYVIQKFFEYGSAEQRRVLGNLLEGQILTLSLQMYGCRVIQKALDAIGLEQKSKLVCELDGHVLRCVRDQNGNHVIQKCIESIPTEKIKFIISSFRGQVAALSTHPYGCRVIQRVLEHSTDELQCQFIVDEILDSVYALAQDQYGNYVTQHVLERGKPEERSEIIHKLAGRIVQLSQHKFASNVVEKCLEYGDSAAREIVINEIVGLGDGSDNLLAMVKDQFANYVVQKVLQTCSDNQREVLLSRIRIHLNSLKKYTYGKHIVARFEQLYGQESEAEAETRLVC